MKKWLMVLGVVTVLVLSGCAQAIPESVKGALYSAQITLDITVAEAAAAQTEPWVVPADETVERHLARRETQVIMLLKIMEQADKNLEAVIKYHRTQQPWWKKLGKKGN